MQVWPETNVELACERFPELNAVFLVGLQVLINGSVKLAPDPFGS